MMAGLPRLFVAADLSSRRELDTLLARIAPTGAGIKIGLEAYTALGGELVQAAAKQGCSVFLDLKFHDIPTTVARACTNVAALGASLTNVHALGGPRMISAAREALEKHGGPGRTKLLAVTILTSHSEADVRELGFMENPAALVPRLARMARDAGADGVVCSPHEASGVREAAGPDFLIVTPGVRPSGSASNDQQRIATPADAIRSGATHLVVGRPITGAPDPAAAAQAILGEIRATLAGN